MTETIENLSGRKLAILISILLLCQVTCFLIGGLVAPMPANAQNLLATVCRDTSTAKNDTTKWYYNRGKGSCKSVDLGGHDLSETDIVFAFQMPTPRESKILDYSRWQQNLIGVLQVDIKYHSQIEVQPRSRITIDARLAYRNKGDPDDKWTLYTQSVEQRYLYCDIDVKSEEYLYNCSAIPLFELGSLFHDYYLLNVRLPVDTAKMNSHIGHIQDMWLTVINQDERFIKVWLSLKTVFLPCIIGILVWFWRSIQKLQRKPVLLEKMLLCLGLALCLLNVPIEYLTLFLDIPFMLLLEHIRQDLFYAALFSFWIVYAGEHMLIQDAPVQSSAKRYCKHLIAVVMGCVSLLIYDMCVRGLNLINPFQSILGIEIYLTWTFSILAGCYFLFLSYMIFQVFLKISGPMRSDSCLHDIGVLYRVMLFMLATLISATLTVIRIILGQVAEGQWKWDANIELEYTSAFFTGVYGTWNIYIFALLFFYAPSDTNSLLLQVSGSVKGNVVVKNGQLLPEANSDVSRRGWPLVEDGCVSVWPLTSGWFGRPHMLQSKV